MNTPCIGLEHWRQAPGADARQRVRELAGQLLARTPDKRLQAPPGQRPRLLADDGAPAGYVSLSHTRTAGAAAVAEGAIGVDVEWPGRRVRWQGLAGAHFASAERNWIMQQRTVDRKGAFLVLWTLKEAWLKAQGLGIRHLASAVLEPATDVAWRLPGECWLGECRFVDDRLIAAAVWHDRQPAPTWLETTDGAAWRAPGCTRRWLAASQHPEHC